MPTTFERKYRGYKILTDENKGHGCTTEILDKVIDIVDHATCKHNKVLATRLDLRFPQDHPQTDDNKPFSHFAATFTKDLKRKGLNPYYVAVREQSREKHQHYHMVVLVNGNKVQFPHKIIQAAEKHWGNAVKSDKQGLVDHCTTSRSGEKQTNSYRLRRNDPDFAQAKEDCIKRCSYLAKTNTKGNTPKHAREVFSSRVPRSKN